MRNLGLFWKLGGALLLVIIVSLGLTAYLANITTTREFNQFFMGGMMGPGGMMSGVLDAAQQDLLHRINNSIWIAGLIAAAIALLLGFLLTRLILSPVRELTKGASKISRGELDYRVKVESTDELGALAYSFNQMADTLDKGEQSRKRLMADIAHELRTPLTIIDGTVSGIMDGVLPADPEHLGTVKEQTALLAKLISDLRDLSLAEAGQLKLQLAPADIVELVRRKLAQIEPAAQKKSIALTLNASEVPSINVDATRMEQVMANLLTNAMQHTPKGGNITISVEKIDSNVAHGMTKPSILVSVTDTGEGIPAEHLPYIFDRFYRVAGARSRDDGGTGLGLAIVKQMVETHGGKVWAESQVGKGSTFHVALAVY